MAEPEARGTNAPEGSLVAALRGALHDGVELLRVRLELVSVEAREHSSQVVELAVLGVAATLLCGMGLLFVAALLTVLWWDSHRLLALGAFSGVFIGLGTVALWLALRRWQKTRHWFAASLDELRQDAQRLKR